MTNRDYLDQILAELEAISTLDEFQRVVRDLSNAIEVDHVDFLWVDAEGKNFYFGTHSEDWAKRYRDPAFVRLDPIVTGCYQRFHPVDWKRLDWSSKSARTFWSEAHAYGVGNQGYSIPVRGPNGQFALFSINHQCEDAVWDSFIAAHSRELILLAHFLNRKALEFEPDRSPDQRLPLSPREVDTLTLLAVGYSRAQVAETLSISEHTLRVYIEGARFKLGAINTTHAIARATSSGLIIV